jgi:Cro/C1-type HTH DNA-binding domain
VIKLDAQRLDLEAGIRGLRAGELCELAGISEATLSRARAGRPLNPRTLAALARVLTQVKPLAGAQDLVMNEKKTTANQPVVFTREVADAAAPPAS